MAAGVLGAVHAEWVILMVLDLRLVDGVLNVMARKPDLLCQPSPNNDDGDDDDDDQPCPSGCRHLLSTAQDAGGNGGNDSDNSDKSDGGGNDGRGNNSAGNNGDTDGDRDENENEDGGWDGGRDEDGGGDGGVEALPRGLGRPFGARGLTQSGGNNTRRCSTGRRSINTTPLDPTRERGWSAGERWSG
ncbi:hypothetical protein HOY80DRAFT_1024378 [Tuber brumale]|nr:hypothetical protein HOY80DRAFT_1024378 [Tuber brumale]